jgi:hypothetical protein
VAWGHELGLHFDCGYYGDEIFERIESTIEFEKNLLEQIYGTKILSFSYHNPNQTSLKYQDDYAGLVNAYNKIFSMAQLPMSLIQMDAGASRRSATC